MTELLDKIAWMRDLTGRPVGIKTAVGGWRFMNEHGRRSCIAAAWSSRPTSW